MGANGSSLLGKAQPPPFLLQFTTTTASQIQSLLNCHTQDLGSVFALHNKAFYRLLSSVLELPITLPVKSKLKDEGNTKMKSPSNSKNDKNNPAVEWNERQSTTIFTTIFDTDKNKLVDAYEVIIVLTILSTIPLTKKLELIYGLYDFTEKQELSRDGLIILLKTVLVGLSKVDKKITPPSQDEIEALSVFAFKGKGGKDKDQTPKSEDEEQSITLSEFTNFVLEHPNGREFVSFWDGMMTPVILRPGELFVDREFSGTTSVYNDVTLPPKGMTRSEDMLFKRSTELHDQPVLFNTGDRFTLVQGSTANNWFTSALSILTSQPHLTKALFKYTGQEVNGRYCCQFYKQGNLVNVFIDDLVACDMFGKPLFLTSGSEYEMWPVLVEKGYAKLHGGYENLINDNDGTCDDTCASISISYSLGDLTGGVCTSFDTNTHTDASFNDKLVSGEYWSSLKTWLNAGVLGCSTSNNDNSIRNGLLKNHGYGITQLIEVINEKKQKVKMIKLTNPWQNGDGWSGDWSVTSNSWEDNRDFIKVCKFKPGDASSFWMSFTDFCSVFNVIYYSKIYDVSEYQCVLRSGDFAEKGGGCYKMANKTWVENDQILLDVAIDTVVTVTITQEDSRYSSSNNNVLDKDRPSIGLVIHPHTFPNIDLGNTPKLLTINPTQITLQTQFSKRRDVTVTGKVPAGRYALLPMTLENDVGGGVKWWVSIHASERVNVYDGFEVDWVKDHLKFDLLADGGNEGVKNESEETIVDRAEANESESHREITNENIAVQSAARMIGVLSDLAQDLEIRKNALERRLDSIKSAIDIRVKEEIEKKGDGDGVTVV